MDPIINETQINIILDTNIPSNSQISLTKNILHNSLLTNIDSYSEYPFFSWWIPYPRDILVTMDYASQVDFFFKKEDFIKILKQTNDYQIFSKKMEEKKLINKKKRQTSRISEANSLFMLDKTTQNNNAKNNIMIMLTLLFPTSFPTSTNILNTYDQLFLNIANKSSVSSIIPFLLNISFGIKSEKPKYSYIKLPSVGVCTVTQVVWLNDIYNHPEYKKIIFEFDNFQIWKIREKVSLNNEIDQKMKLFDDNNIIGESWNELIKRLDTINVNEIPDYRYNPYNQYNYNNQYSEKQINYKDEFNKLKILLKNKNLIINNKNYEDLFKIKKYYNDLNNVIRSRLYDIVNVNVFISNIQKIQINNHIIHKYLENESFNIIQNNQRNNIMTQDENMINQEVQKWEGYKKYNDFIRLLQNFNKINNESTNDLLQNTIDKFIQGYKNNDFEKLLNPYNSKNNDIIKLVDTGITIKKSSEIKNTIYVRMDLIIGELNDSNKNSINCNYNNSYLGNQLNMLLNASEHFWQLDEKRFLFDLNKMKVIEDVSNNQINQKRGDNSKINNQYQSNRGLDYGNNYDSRYGNNYNPTYGNNYNPTYGNNYNPRYGNNYNPSYDLNYGGTKLKKRKFTRKKRN